MVMKCRKIRRQLRLWRTVTYTSITTKETRLISSKATHQIEGQLTPTKTLAMLMWNSTSLALGVRPYLRMPIIDSNRSQPSKTKTVCSSSLKPIIYSNPNRWCTNNRIIERTWRRTMHSRSGARPTTTYLLTKTAPWWLLMASRIITNWTTTTATISSRFLIPTKNHLLWWMMTMVMTKCYTWMIFEMKIWQVTTSMKLSIRAIRCWTLMVKKMLIDSKLKRLF